MLLKEFNEINQRAKIVIIDKIIKIDELDKKVFSCFSFRTWQPKYKSKLSRFGIELGSGTSSLLRNRFNYKLKEKVQKFETTSKPKLGLKFSKSKPQSPCSASMKCIESKNYILAILIGSIVIFCRFFQFCRSYLFIDFIILFPFVNFVDLTDFRQFYRFFVL